MLQLILKNGGDPYIKNRYGKNTFDLVQDEKDAAGNILSDRSEIRSVLEAWESKLVHGIRLLFKKL